jgi:hypothetical protein
MDCKKGSLTGLFLALALLTSLLLAAPAGAFVYWADTQNQRIGRAENDGSGVNDAFVQTGELPFAVAVNSANIFWTEPGIFGGGTRIGRANTNTGTGADPSFIGDAKTPCGITAFGSQIYWANSETNSIARANSDGTAVNQSFIATGANQPCDVAVDNLASPPPPPPPAGSGTGGGGGSGGSSADTTPPTTTIAKGPGRKLAKGKARFSFRSSESGSRFVCKLDRRKVEACTSPKRYARLEAGSHTFKVWAIDAAGNKDPTPAKRRFKVPG